MSTTRTRSRGAAIGLGVAATLMVLAMAVPAVFDWNVRVNSFPPLHAEWDPRLGPGSLPALLLAVAAALYAGRLSERLRWRTLLLVVFVGGLAWLLALAYVDGNDGIGKILEDPYEYLRTARRTSDLHATLQEYVSRIRYDAIPRNWPVHIAGHPPGALTFFVVLVRIGLGDGLAAGYVVTVAAATTAVAVMVTTRTLGAERLARRAAPFLVFGPAAVWQAVSADALFAAVAAWGMACLALAATRRTRSWVAWSALAGLLLGYCVMMSYGLPLLGVLALAVLLTARSWRPLPVAAVAAVLVVAAFWVAGFSYLEALPAIHDRYWEGVGGRRPESYWWWGNLAALAFSAGPLVGAGVGHLLARGRDLAREAQTRTVVLLAGGGVGMVTLADLSLMSKAEVERIWLPFVPWLLLSCALLPERWRRLGLVLQLVAALVIAHLLHTGW